MTKLAATFADQALAQDLLTKIIEIQVNDSLTITTADVVNSYADTIYFGPKNEYSVVLKDKQLIAVDNIAFENHKTKSFIEFTKAFNIDKKLLIVTDRFS